MLSQCIHWLQPHLGWAIPHGIHWLQPHLGWAIPLLLALAAVSARVVNYILASLYSGPYALVWMRGQLIGVKTIYLSDPALAKKVLSRCTVKGDFIERHASQAAWRPILSVESEDGASWERLRSRFNITHQSLLKKLPELRIIAEKHCKLFIQSRVDHAALCRLSITIFLEFVSGSADPETVEVLYRGVQVWRQEIAVKGWGEYRAKEASVTALRNALKVLPGEDISHIAQPFIISPAINIGDIFSSPRLATGVYSKGSKSSSLTSIILASHPFPFLERFTTEQIDSIPAYTQVFIPLAEMAATHPEQWMVFSVGARMCPGANYATIVLETMLDILAGHPNFHPTEGHRFSGRQNDQTMDSILHPLWVFARGVLASKGC